MLQLMEVNFEQIEDKAGERRERKVMSHTPPMAACVEEGVIERGGWVWGSSASISSPPIVLQPLLLLLLQLLRCKMRERREAAAADTAENPLLLFPPLPHPGFAPHGQTKAEESITASAPIPPPSPPSAASP